MGIFSLVVPHWKSRISCILTDHKSSYTLLYIIGLFRELFSTKFIFRSCWCILLEIIFSPPTKSAVHVIPSENSDTFSWFTSIMAEFLLNTSQPTNILKGSPVAIKNTIFKACLLYTSVLCCYLECVVV